jgi:MFS family permease
MGRRPGGAWRTAADAVLTVVGHRNLRRAEISFGSAWTAEWALTVGLGVVAYRDGGAVAVGVVAFVRLLPAAALTPLATSLADRYPRDRVLRWACALRAGAMAVAAVALAADAPLVLVYGAATAATVAFTLFRPAHSALLPSLCANPAELVSAHVVRGLIDSLSSFAGPLLAAGALRAGDPWILFAIIAALAAVSGWQLTDLRYEHAPLDAARPAARLFSETLEGLRTLVRFPDARRLVVLAGAQTFTRGALNVFAIVVVVDLLGVADDVTGVLLGVLGAGAVIGSLVLAAVVDGSWLARYVGIGVTFWGLPLVAIGAWPEWPVVLVAMGVIGVGNALVDVGLFTVPARLVPDALLARFFGALESVVAICVACGSLATPALIALLGRRGALVAVGLLGPLLALAWWHRLRDTDDVVSGRDEEIRILKSIAMFDRLPMPAIETIAARVGHELVEPGQVVVAQGAPGDRYYVITAGTAVVRRNGEEIRHLGAGDGFGEIGLLRDVPRTASVVAESRLELRTIRRADFLGPVTGYASAAQTATEVVAGHLAADAAADGDGADGADGAGQEHP